MADPSANHIIFDDVTIAADVRSLARTLMKARGTLRAAKIRYRAEVLGSELCLMHVFENRKLDERRAARAALYAPGRWRFEFELSPSVNNGFVEMIDYQGRSHRGQIPYDGLPLFERERDDLNKSHGAADLSDIYCFWTLRFGILNWIAYEEGTDFERFRKDVASFTLALR